MTDATPPFTAAEYDRRIAKTRAAMDAAGIDVMIVTYPSNQNWLTGYDGWSFYVHQAVVLPLAGQPYWWGRRQDANGALRTVDTGATGMKMHVTGHSMGGALGMLASLELAARGAAWKIIALSWPRHSAARVVPRCAGPSSPAKRWTLYA